MQRKKLRVLKRFGKIDILVCHQPPYGILDKVNFPGVPDSWKGKHAGSKIILDYVKKFQPKYVFCGHIHEGEGKKKVGKSLVYNLGVGSNVVVEL
jgi:Icc-related predicted phosphoesterase